MRLHRCPAPGCATLTPRPQCYFHTPPPDPAPPSPHPIVAAVAAEYLLHPANILGHGREYPLPDARREVIRRMLRDTTLSVSEIGRALGLDHSSVCYHRDAIYAREPA